MFRREALRWALADFRRRAGDLLPRSFDPSDAAICTIHGNSDVYTGELALRFAWPKLQIERLRRFTPPGYTIYAYGNNLLPEHEEFLLSCPEVRLFSSGRGPTYPALRNYWAIRNWLARQAARRYRFIVHLDSDAFPVRHGWLQRYARLLSWNCPVVAVQRVENGDTHSDRCFLMCRRVDLHRHLLDFSHIGVKDAGAGISADLEAKGLQWKALRRSNSHDYHPVIAGIYDDHVYHHAAGSREPRLRQNAHLWDSPDLWEREICIHRCLMERLFQDPDGLIAELRGERSPIALEWEQGVIPPRRPPPLRSPAPRTPEAPG